MILFKTVHGSRLYGLSKQSSDYDYYTVVTKPERDYRFGRQPKAKYAKQSIVDGNDSVTIDIGTWMNQLRTGVPQAWEAAFSQQPIVDKISAFRNSLVAGPEVFDTYLRTIKSFALAEDDTTKRRRHALRLALNLQSIGRYGRFNPTLSEEDAKYITNMSTKSHSDVYGLALCLGWDIL